MARARKSARLSVAMNGRPVGVLNRAANGAISFVYDKEWLADERRAIPVSLSLPLREERYSGAEVSAFFDNLLPDNDQIRRKVAEKAIAEGFAFKGDRQGYLGDYGSPMRDTALMIALTQLLYLGSMLWLTELGLVSWLGMGSAVLLGSSALFTMSPLVQAQLIDAAPQSRQVVLALNGSMMFLGQGAGAALGRDPRGTPLQGADQDAHGAAADRDVSRSNPHGSLAGGGGFRFRQGPRNRDLRGSQGEETLRRFRLFQEHRGADQAWHG